MPKKPKLFKDVPFVEQSHRIGLRRAGLLKNDKVISSVPLAHRMRDKTITPHQAKLLALVELEREDPRVDILHRLVRYVSNSAKARDIAQLKKVLK